MDKLVLTSSPDPRSLDECLKRLDGRQFSWAYFGQSISEFRSAQSRLDGHGDYVDTTHGFHQAGGALREPFLALLAGMGKDLGSIRWWITSLSWRSVYNSKAFHQSCYLKVGLELVQESEPIDAIVLVLPDLAVRRAMKRNLAHGESIRVQNIGSSGPQVLSSLRDLANMLSHRVFFFCTEALRQFRSRHMTNPVFQDAGPLTILISWATPSNLRLGGRFYESYLGDLADRLANEGHDVAIAPITVKEASYGDALNSFQQTPHALLDPNRVLNLWDAAAATIKSMAQSPKSKLDPVIDGMDISTLVAEDLHSHWVSNRSCRDLLTLRLAEKWAKRYDIARIIYIYENQPWERALCWQMQRSSPKTKMVGYQHAAVPLMALNFYLAPGEEQDAPLPGRIVTVGRHTANLLTSAGYSADRVVAGGAIQMQQGASPQPEAITPGPAEFTLLVAPSGGGEDEAAELVDAAIRMFSKDEGIKILIKCHPILPFQKIAGLLDPVLPNHVSVTEEPINDLMARCSALVYTDTIASLTALSCGLPVVHYSTQYDFNLDPLQGTGAHLEVIGRDELRRKVIWLKENRDDYVAQHREQWTHLVAELLGPVTEETVHAFEG